MRLFLYYAVHTFINQIRKLFKTWVAIFLVVCLLFGALIGFGAATISNLSSDSGETSGEINEDTDSETNYSTETDESTVDTSHDDSSVMSSNETIQIIEAASSLIILAVFMFCVYTSGNGGSKIFIMADVNLLFSAPIKPQSVLLFRLMCKMGSMFIASVYLIFQIPNLIINLQLSAVFAWMLIPIWFFTLAFGQLLSVLVYTLTSTHSKLKKHVKTAVYIIAALLVAGFILHWQSGSSSPTSSAISYLSAPWTRFIPVWGWLKAIIYYSYMAEFWKCGLFIAALIISIGVLTYFIWQIKADFYEDALKFSEEAAQKLRNTQDGAKIVKRRKKDRSDKLVRDEFHSGWGASVYFCKAMYNRARFAKFKFFTTTSVTYLVAAVLTSVLTRRVFQSSSVVPVVIVLGIMVFFRALGNPIAQDTEQDHFCMIPDSAFKKVMYSLLGGTATCLLDLLPALIAGCIISGGDFVSAAVWLILITTIDLYASSVGAFISLSLPTSLAKTIRSVIQIMFIYFGLIPLAGIIAVGLVMDKFIIFSLIAILFNVVISGVFTALCPIFIKNGRK